MWSAFDKIKCFKENTTPIQLQCKELDFSSSAQDGWRATTLCAQHHGQSCDGGAFGCRVDLEQTKRPHVGELGWADEEVAL